MTTKSHSDPDRTTWAGILAYLRAHHPAICRQWFDEIDPIGTVGGAYYLRAQSAVHRDYLRRQCNEAFTEAGQNVTGELMTVRFIGPEDDLPMPGDNGQAKPAPQSIETPQSLAINPDHDFDAFIVGPSNRYAHAAAKAVSDSPGEAYNPLFIHGKVGLGKTHLLQAICLNIKQKTPGAKIHYLSCESFVNHFTDSIRAGLMSHFRHWFRDVDVLLIDDIHLLAARVRSQDEFFHTFNTLYQAKKQLVLSSDAPPENIPDLEERLISRFKWGLVTHIEPPDYETRVMIVQAKAQQRGLKLSSDVACLVADRVNTNIRELEGDVTKLQIFASLEKIETITPEMVLTALGKDNPAATSGPTIGVIADGVTEFYGIRLTDLQSKKRHRSITQPRQLCMYLARHHTRHSLEEIGHYFGGRDHTTVMHAIKAVEERRKESGDFDIVVRQFENKLAPNNRPHRPAPDSHGQG